jgi:hypothetical protein
LKIDVRRGSPGVDLRLTEGGSIEGAVLVPPGRDPVGTIVVIARGDGFARTTRVGPDGTFRFENLIAGRWLVTTHEKELNETTSSSKWTTDSVREIPWNCEVLEAAHRTSTSICAPRRRRAIVQGILRVRGAELGKWTAMSAPRDESRTRRQLRRARCVRRVRARDERAAKMTIVLPALDGPFDGLRVLADVDVVKGVAQRNVELDGARLTVDASKPRVRSACSCYLVSLDERTFAMRPIPTKAEPTEKLVPAGKGRISAPPAENPSKDPRQWPVLVDVTLALGEAKRVTVP